MTISPDGILAEIPGWKGARYTKLRGGLTNVTWHVVHGDRSGVLKIDEDGREEPLNTRSMEAMIQTTAAKAGLAPKVILAREGMYFAEYVEGTVWKRSYFDTDANLEELASALKRLHSMPLTGRSFDAISAAKRYTEEIKDLDADTISLHTNATDAATGVNPVNLTPGTGEHALRKARAGIYPETDITAADSGGLYEGTFSLTHEGGATDASRYVGSLAPGETATKL